MQRIIEKVKVDLININIKTKNLKLLILYLENQVKIILQMIINIAI